MLYVTSLSGSFQANFAFVYTYYVSSKRMKLIFYPRRILGHTWLEWIREKHNSQACCSYI